VLSAPLGSWVGGDELVAGPPPPRVARQLASPSTRVPDRGARRERAALSPRASQHIGGRMPKKKKPSAGEGGEGGCGGVRLMPYQGQANVLTRRTRGLCPVAGDEPQGADGTAQSGAPAAAGSAGVQVYRENFIPEHFILRNALWGTCPPYHLRFHGRAR